MSTLVNLIEMNEKELRANCENCFGLCCVALPYAKSADFAFNKEGGTPCRHLCSDFRCEIHQNLREKGFRGCTVYECYGAGQRVSELTYVGKDWRENQAMKEEMFKVFPIMQQLHEMLWYLYEALHREETKSIMEELKLAFSQTDGLTKLSPEKILELDVTGHRANINELLLQTSKLVRAKAKQAKVTGKVKIDRGSDLIGANLKGANLRGASLRGALLIGANLQNADMRHTDLIGADFRDANLSGANLTGCIFLTQAQINSAKGSMSTKLPRAIVTPSHWK